MRWVFDDQAALENDLDLMAEIVTGLEDVIDALERRLDALIADMQTSQKLPQGSR
jgi:hypothetical protein